MSDVPFSRFVSARDVPAGGSRIKISAEPQERVALAELLGLPAIARLDARLEIKPWGRGGLVVRGEVDGEVTQTCVVMLDEFDTAIHEEVEVRFIEAEDRPRQDEIPGAEHEADLDAPDVLDNGRANLGALVAEHLALALDPYPRKPGVEIEEPAAVPEEEEAPATHRPFAGLDKLVTPGKSGKN